MNESIMRNPGVYKGIPYKGDTELEEIAGKVVALLRSEALPIWQAREVLKIADRDLDWETLK